MDTKPSNAVFRVLYFGDSLTEGSELPPEQKAFVWPTLVQENSGGTFQAINEGLGGRPTDSVSAFQRILGCHDHAFDLMVIALGGNDTRDISGQCIPNAVRNIGEMIALTRAARPGIPILLVGPANIRKDTLGATKSIGEKREQNLRDLTAAYEKLAAETSCRFVSLYGVIPPASLAADGVHPDADGNRAVAAKMLEALTRLAQAPLDGYKSEHIDSGSRPIDLHQSV
jgi:acyl-CoA thioesterase-1